MFRTILAVLTFSAVAGASTVTFSTSPGAVETGGNAVSASAAFTTSNGQITVTLSNLLTAAQMNTVAQDLSDLSFTLSGVGGTTTAYATGLVSDANRSYTGTFINVGTNGAVTSASGVTANGWDFSNIGSTFVLEDLGSLAGPAQTIIGGTAGSFTAYSNAGGSIANNGPHNPFIQGFATFTLNVAGVTADTTVKNVVFSFGTTLGDNVSGCLVGGPNCTSTTVPEPITSGLVGSGLIALFFLRRRVRG